MKSSYFVKKASESEGGHGIYYIDKQLNDGLDRAINEIDGDIIIQDELKQHKDISKLNSFSVNTIRVLSLLSERGVKIYSTILRMGINGVKVDNASSGGITCGINADGCLKKYAYQSNGEKFTEHPTSKVKFDEVTITSYPGC